MRFNSFNSVLYLSSFDFSLHSFTSLVSYGALTNALVVPRCVYVIFQFELIDLVAVRSILEGFVGFVLYIDSLCSLMDCDYQLGGL